MNLETSDIILHNRIQDDTINSVTYVCPSSYTLSLTILNTSPLSPHYSGHAPLFPNCTEHASVILSLQCICPLYSLIRVNMPPLFPHYNGLSPLFPHYSELGTVISSLQ